MEQTGKNLPETKPTTRSTRRMPSNGKGKIKIHRAKYAGRGGGNT